MTDPLNIIFGRFENMITRLRESSVVYLFHTTALLLQYFEV